MKAKIYVAASSQDLSRYRQFVKRAAARGIENTHDWSSLVEAAMKEGRTDATVSEDFARQSALSDAAGVRDAAIVVMLAPMPAQLTIGAWVELGMALGLRTARPSRRPFIIVVGVRSLRRQYSIFEELADLCVETEEAALDAVARLAYSMELEDPQGLDLEDVAALVAADGGGAA